MPDIDVAIVGGGISGLAAAYELEQHGVSYRLFERAPRLGGVIRTEQIDGFTLDGGPDSLLVQKPAAIELCHALGLGDRLVPTLPPRTAFVVRRSRLVTLPEASVLGIPTRLAPLVTSGLLSASGLTRLAADLRIPASKSPDDESVGAFFGRRFGQEAVDYIAEPLLAGIHAGDVNRLSMRALFPRLIEVERAHGSLIRRFRTLLAAAPRPKDGMFRSLPGGIGELAATLTAQLPPERLMRGHQVARLDGGPPFVLTTEGERWTARQTLLTTPAPVTAALVSSLDPTLEQLCGGIPYSSTATVFLAYPRASIAHPLKGSGFVVPKVERDLTIMAGSWVTSKWPGRAPEGWVLLRAFFGEARTPEAITWSDDRLIEVAHRDFATLLTITESPRLRRVYRWTRLNPQLEVGHLERLAAIDRRLERWPGLFITGAGFRGVGIPDCVANSRRVAREMAEAVRA